MIDSSSWRRQFNKKYGEGSALSAADLKAESAIPYGISATCLTLDLAIGRPGFPAGRLTEILALESRGKSSLLYHTFATCQKSGGIAVLIEAERGFESDRLEVFGVNTDDLLLCQPANMEQALGMIEDSIHHIRVVSQFSGPVVIGLDSVAKLQTGVEDERGYDEFQMGLAARILSQGMRKLMRIVAQHKIVLIFINQQHYTMQQYGEEFRGYGGQSIPTSASLRIVLNSKRGDIVRKGREPHGVWIHADIRKSKIGVPNNVVKFLFLYKTGIDQVEDLWQAATFMGMLKSVGGGNFKFGKETTLRREQWENYIVEKFGDVEHMKEALTKFAFQRGFLLPYK